MSDGSRKNAVRSRPIRTLLFSTLFPSSARPNHGIFVETRLRELLASGEVETRVVAPVPWFPSRDARFGEWAKMAATPRFEQRNGIAAWHPRYLLPPKVGMNIAPWALAWGARATVARLIRDGFDFDVIDAHYYYPDGIAASILARWFDKPFVVTARGSDLNLLPSFAWPRRLIQRTAAQAAASIGVCEALMTVLQGLGADPQRLHVMRNGVDLERFRPLPPAQMRAELGLPPGPLILSVGNLVELKGHHLTIEALNALPDAQLVIVGDGEARDNLLQLARAQGMQHRVRLVGRVPNAELARWYSAADVLVLASSREGWANVLLESLACGTPVVATQVGGTAEVVTDPRVGHLLAERSAAAIAAGVRAMLQDPPPRDDVRRYAEGFSWQATTAAQLALFDRVIAERAGLGAHPSTGVSGDVHA